MPLCDQLQLINPCVVVVDAAAAAAAVVAVLVVAVVAVVEVYEVRRCWWIGRAVQVH